MELRLEVIPCQWRREDLDDIIKVVEVLVVILVDGVKMTNGVKEDVAATGGVEYLID